MTDHHCCSRCGQKKPLAEFYRWRVGNPPTHNWYCDDCRRALWRDYRERTGPSTPRVQRYRQDPEKAERDRQRSRAWKERNRERNRARDREYFRRKRAEQST